MMPLVYIAAGLGLALLLALQMRMAKRLAEAREAFERVEKAQRDGALDVRQRLEESTREAERFEARWKEAQDRLDAAEERVGAVGPVIEEARLARTTAEDGIRSVEARIAAVEESVRAAAERLDQALREHRDGLDVRVRDQEEKVSALAGRVNDVEALGARLVASIPSPLAKRDAAPPGPPAVKAASPGPVASPSAPATAVPVPPATQAPAGLHAGSAPHEATPVRPARTPAVASAAAAPKQSGVRAFLLVVFVLAAAMVLVSWLA